MNNRIILIIALIVFLATATTLISADNSSIKAIPADVKASDLASMLGVRWWAYNLQFDKPVSGVFFRLCELRRQPDGTWQRTYLARGFGHATSEPKLREVAVAVLMYNKPNDYDFGIRLDNNFYGSKFSTWPDFSRTYSIPSDSKFSNCAKLINGCIALAIEEKNPQTATDREENWVRIIGLEIELE